MEKGVYTFPMLKRRKGARMNNFTNTNSGRRSDEKVDVS